MKLFTGALRTGLLAITLIPTAGAVDIDWNSISGGAFSTPINWNGAVVPAAPDSARFNLGSTAGYTVNFLGDHTTGFLSLGNDSVTLDLGGFAYSQTSLAAQSLQLGQVVTDSATLTLLNGSLNSLHSTVGGGDATAVLNVSTGATWSANGIVSVNANATVNVTNGGIVGAFSTNVLGSVNLDGVGSQWIGSVGNPMTVSNGAALNITNGAVYTGSGINGSLIVKNGGTAVIDGAGSTVSGGVAVGIGSGLSTLTLRNGATLNGGALIGDFGGGDGIVNVSGVGTTWNGNSAGLSLLVGGQNQGFLNISGGATVVSGLAQVAFENGGFVTVDGAGTSWSSNGLSLGFGDDASLTISNAATVNTVGLDVGQPGARDDRVVTVDVGGAGSSLNTGLNMTVTSSSLSGAANNTTVTVHDGASLSVGNRLKMTQGVLTINTGANGTIGTGAPETASNTLRIHADGELQLNTKPINSAADTVLNVANIELAGNFGGDGTINGDLNNASGHVGPGVVLVSGVVGGRTGTLTLNGDYTQGALGQLDIDLSGLIVGEFDVLDIAGLATLDGMLGLGLSGGFTPVLGDTFDILSADTIIGQFSALDSALSPLAAGLSWDVSYFLDPTLDDVVRLSVVAAPVPIPASAWLLISGLITLVGVSRRRVLI